MKGSFFLQELLNSLHERYEEWLIKKNTFYIPAPVVVSVLPAQVSIAQKHKQHMQMQDVDH